MPSVSDASLTPIFSALEKFTIGACVVAALSLGAYGYAAHYAATGADGSVSNVLYSAVSLFFFQYFGGNSGIPWQLDIARWLAPASLSYAAARAIAAATQERLALWRIRRLKQHAVLVGVDNASLHVVRSLRENGVPTLVVAPSSTSKYLATLKQLGAYILTKDELDSSVLQHCALKNARFLLAFSDSDTTNLELAELAFESRSTFKPGHFLKCAIRIERPALANALSGHAIFSVDYENFSAQLISRNSMESRWLFGAWGPDVVAFSQTVKSDPATVMVLGDTDLAKSLVCRLAVSGHYGQAGKLPVTLAGENAARTLRDLITSQPQLSDYLQINIVPTAFGPANIDAVEAAIAEYSPGVIYVCVESAVDMLTSCQVLKQLSPDCPVVVSDSNGVATKHNASRCS